MKNLSLREVSRLSGVGYTSCSQLLNGRLNHPIFLARITAAIKAAQPPQEVAA